MKQRPDGDVEIDEKFWEEDFHIPTCEKCNGVLKPDVWHHAFLITTIHGAIYSRPIPEQKFLFSLDSSLV